MTLYGLLRDAEVTGKQILVVFEFFNCSRMKTVPMMKTGTLSVKPQKASADSYHLASTHAVVISGDYETHWNSESSCGFLIRDLMQYFKPNRVFDPTPSSGACRDVCEELGIDVVSVFLYNYFDCFNPKDYNASGSFDFIWIQPPYWRLKVCNDGPYFLSSSRDLSEFLSKLSRVIVNCESVLAPGGHLAILMDDFGGHEFGFEPLTSYTKQLCIDAGLNQDCTKCIRFNYDNTSSNKTYQSKVIPKRHEICLILEK